MLRRLITYTSGAKLCRHFSLTSCKYRLDGTPICDKTDIEVDDGSLKRYELLFVFVPIACFGFAYYHYKGRIWKEDLLAKIDRMDNPPIELPTNLDDLASMEFQKFRVRGHYLYDKEIHYGPRICHNLRLVPYKAIYKGFDLITGWNEWGYNIFTPFKLIDRDLIIFVNRGWTQRKFKYVESRPRTQGDDEVEVVGVLQLNEKAVPILQQNDPIRNQWQFRDLEHMGEVAGAYPIVLDITALDNENLPWEFVPDQTVTDYYNYHPFYIHCSSFLGGITLLGWLYRMKTRLRP